MARCFAAQRSAKCSRHLSGASTRMRAFETLTSENEIARARVEVARWYNDISRGRLMSVLEAAQWAPGHARESRFYERRE